jgi:long-chain fatty acid transport protein
MKHLVAWAVLGAPLAGMATDGYFAHGYGIKAKGMGGASVTQTDNAFAGANNPAASAWAGNRMEGGLDVFMPRRGMNRTGSVYGLDGDVDSGSNTFFVPEFGYNRAINDKIGVGIAVYGNGGMNTNYAGGTIQCQNPTTGAMYPANMLCGQGDLGVDLMQLIIAPTVAYKFNENHAVGVSPLLVYQQFESYGVQLFQGMSAAPGSVSNNGYDRSTGLGVRLGYLGKLTDKVSVGASYAPRIKMGKLDKYAGLFAGGGSFDIPENYSLGVSVQATPKLSVALDYQRINYAGVPSVGNPSTNMAPLGAAGAPGFGWSDIDIWKLGVQWQATPQLTLRAGVNRGQNPIQPRDVTFNIIAPGVTTTHLTLGGTYALSPSTELTVAYMHAPRKSVSGASMFNALMGPGAGGTETIRMSQNSLGVQVGWRF